MGITHANSRVPADAAAPPAAKTKRQSDSDAVTSPYALNRPEPASRPLTIMKAPKATTSDPATAASSP
jgi:hypothetical protein